MSKAQKRFETDIGDSIALKIQKMRMEGKISGNRPLLRIDNRSEAAEAPFQFDTVKLRLHRADCQAIPEESRTALYAVWKITPNDLLYACKKCRPALKKEKAMDNKKDTSDIFFGFLSILDQFGSILSERGREFRNSKQGRQIEGTVENLISELDQKQKDAVEIVISSLDGVIKIIKNYNENLKFSENGRNGNGEMEKKPGENVSLNKNHLEEDED